MKLFKQESSNQEEVILLKIDEKRKIAFKIGTLVLQARIHARLSQADLAKRLNTKQPSIARIESGKALPSIEFLFKIARSINTEFIFPTFGFLDPNSSQNRSIR